MKNNPGFKSDVFAAIHSAASGLHRAGGIDKATMRDFDETCLSVPMEMEPQQINPRKSDSPTGHPPCHGEPIHPLPQ